MTKSIWRKRFPHRREDQEFESLNRSIDVDARLFREEIAATRAHARALQKAGIYDPGECDRVLDALEKIEEEISAGEIPLCDFEDIHTVVESRLTELTGEAGAKIQTGRSRNEQTVTAQRLFMKKALGELIDACCGLQQAVLNKAESWVDVIFPGYTHMRPAQPIRFSHYLCAFFFGLERDRERMTQALARIDASPAGVAALAGSPFGLDRRFMAELLDFSRVSENTLDTVSDRDGNMEVLSVLSILMVRLSRLAEDLLLWSSPAFGFVELDEAYCTSSSLMPQKKNPDSLELLRGKTGRVISNLVSLLITCKGLPCGYQKDLQEDKEPLFQALDTTLACVKVCAGIVTGLRIDASKALQAVPLECLATDRADQLVKEGVPFREAYDRVAQSFSATGSDEPNESDASDSGPGITPEESVERRAGFGGTSRNDVLAQIARGRKKLES